MNTAEIKNPAGLAHFTHAWLGLVALTFASLYLGHWFHGTAWLQILVAAIIWLKGILVATHFIEIKEAHAFIRRVVLGFVAVTPLALLVIAYFGNQVARWATL